ncbi:MAG: transposase [Solirubrobacteraceae bacterium]
MWSFLGVVEQMGLGAFCGAYRAIGQGRAAFEPLMVVALLLYVYGRGDRSLRGIERACLEGVTYRVITAMRVPDHSMIAEFRRRHERALAELFCGVLVLGDEAGLVEVGVISIDGTKVRANASRARTAATRSWSRTSSGRPRRPTVGRTGCSVLAVVTSCRSICALRSGAARRSSGEGSAGAEGRSQQGARGSPDQAWSGAVRGDAWLGSSHMASGGAQGAVASARASGAADRGLPDQ